MKRAERPIGWVFLALLSFFILFRSDIKALAAENPLDNLAGGVAPILCPAAGTSASELINATANELNIDLSAFEEPESDLVMANVKNALNVREEPDSESAKVGKLYKDCGGTILERGDEWTLLQSGNVVGWCSNEYLLFDDEALELAEDVGRTMAKVVAQGLRVREEATIDSSIRGFVPEGDVYEVVDDDNEEWVCIDFEGADGYISAEYVEISFQLDYGETMEEIKAREEAEREAKRHKNYGAYTTDADTTLLLAALIQCEAGAEIYEGKLAVASVVMNRVRSAAYPDSIHGVIYASGQFTPALNGKVNTVYLSGKINAECKKAAEEAISGISNVGDATHFRRNNGRDGIVIGNHVFY